MTLQPFSIFLPYEDRVKICMLTKQDAVQTDSEAGSLLGGEGASLHQVHGNRTVVITTPEKAETRADGMLTQQCNLPLCIRWADCQNFIVYAPEQHVVGLLHAGWRGLIAGAIPAFFQELQTQFSVSPENVLVGAGPSLCTACAGFSNPAEELPTLQKQFIEGTCANLQGAAEDVLFTLGVLPENFERHADCTRCNPKQYWTYRGGDREHVQQGRVNRLCCSVL
jgi:copper oxidase (laccase) domain-containing protein